MSPRRSKLKDSGREVALFQRRALAGFLIIVVCLGVLASRFVHLQVVRHDEFVTRADQIRIKLRPIPPARGLIFDRNGVLLADNTAAFRLEVEEPLTTTFHGYEIFKSGFWTQGAVMIEALNILEGYPLDAMGWNSPEYLHLLTEALKLAYADRDTWYADPKFEKMPADLLTKAYAAKRREIYLEVEQKLADIAAAAPLVDEYAVWAGKKEVQGLQFNGYTYPVFGDVSIQS